MNLTKQIESLSNKILEDINSSCLHPAISKLILLDIIHAIEKYEFKQEDEEKSL